MTKAMCVIFMGGKFFILQAKTVFGQTQRLSSISKIHAYHVYK